LSGTRLLGIEAESKVEGESKAVRFVKIHWRKGIPSVALTTSSLVICLLVIEVACRIFGLLPPPSRTFQFSPTKGYELVAGHGDINSHGLRDREYSVAKQLGTFRIIAIGDSFTYGSGVAQGETYAKRLEAILNERLRNGSTYFEVLNAGVPGYNTNQELIHLREVGLQFAPDLILVGFTLSDAELGSFGLKDVRSGRWLIGVKEWAKRHFALYAFLTLRVKRLFDLFESLISGGDVGQIGGSAVIPLRLAAKGKASPGWDLCRQSLQGIADIASSRNIPVMLAIFPLLIDLDDSYPFKAEHVLITRVGRENQMIAVDLLPAFVGLEPSSLWVKPTDSHPNARGHSIAAEAIYRGMLSHALVPLTVPPASNASTH